MSEQVKAMLLGMLAAALLIVSGCVGPNDYEAALEQQRLYNEMVCDGHWPPYQGPADCSRNDGEKD